MYNGYSYGAEIARGVDVLRLVPTKFLTQNEIDAANQVHFDELNVQKPAQVQVAFEFHRGPGVCGSTGAER